MSEPEETCMNFQEYSKLRLSKAERKARAKVRAKIRRANVKREKDLTENPNVDLSDYYFSGGFRRKERCANGDITVNEKPVSMDYVIKDSDTLEHKIHRHELPVLDDEVTVIEENEDMLVVCKPSSMPIHPCGQYNLNSLSTIMHKEHGKKGLRFVHRIDRMTSGVVVIAKNYDSANQLAQQISGRNVIKHYLSKVDGKFPLDETVVVDQPLARLCSRMGVNYVATLENGGKPSKTAFHALSYCAKSDTTTLLCRLYTGRTHQIRIHLQYLGFPISNDPVYNSYDWGLTKGKGADYYTPKERLIQKISDSRDKSNYYQSRTKVGNSEDSDEDDISHLMLKHPDKEIQSRLSECFDNNCPDCMLGPSLDPTMDHLMLYLHAYQYSGEEWSYTAPLPKWLLQDSEESEQELKKTIANYIDTKFISDNKECT